jgi:hypothetical protein
VISNLLLTLPSACLYIGPRPFSYRSSGSYKNTDEYSFVRTQQAGNKKFSRGGGGGLTLFCTNNTIFIHLKLSMNFIEIVLHCHIEENKRLKVLNNLLSGQNIPLAGLC